ncbi:cytochrome c oxidase subunit 3 [Pleomorphovibrio marinus]|uniref:cytochrome c oxidase subunit 3 n=1 Tax=Pleomorphovibrio marinus TaxID=2164132 RepID=UPI000E0BB4F9|nr:cytochrome c oxidase subunit 3 [Pleomorphovibrio marinus]
MNLSPATVSWPVKSELSNPPGGLLIWIVILLELFTFGLGLLALVVYGRQEPELFQSAAAHLDTHLGLLNTLVLMGSGFLMAQSVYFARLGNLGKAKKWIGFTLLLGALFVAIKTFEYTQKLGSGLIMDDNMFFTLYWLLTGFHLIHVVVGMVILIVLSFSFKSGKEEENVENLVSGAAFWHMCDLIWLLLFPALYLIY